MAEKSTPQSFLSKESKAWRARQEWEPAAHAFYKPWPAKRRVMEWRRADKNSLNLGYDFEEQPLPTINELHGIDFLADVIPGIIERVRASGSKRKIKILDMGCGLGFFNDQIRSKFKDEVEVYGTGINKSSLKNRKAKIIRNIKDEKIKMDEADKEQILSETDGTLHPNDAKWNSIEELSNFPEFDLIVDSEGEIVYAGGTGVGFFPKGDSTQAKLICAIKKLNPGGQLYISRIHERHRDLTPVRKQELSAQYGVIIEDNNDAHFHGALVIRKTEK
jgi:SAM-dependent methyltransferase